MTVFLTDFPYYKWNITHHFCSQCWCCVVCVCVVFDRLTISVVSVGAHLVHAVDAISDSPERKENSTILPQINWNSFQFYCQIRGNSCQLGLKSLSYFLPEFVLEFNWSKCTEQLDWDTFVVLYVFFTFILASHTFGAVLAKWTYHCFIAIWNQNYPFKLMTKTFHS